MLDFAKSHADLRAPSGNRLEALRADGTSPEFWLGLQGAHDLERAREALGWAA